MTVSMTAGISLKFNRLSRKACTATSSAAFRLAQHKPPSRAASCACRRQGKRSGSGARKSRRPARARSRKSTPAAMRCGQASAWAIGTRMSGAGQLREHRAVVVLDQRVHDALRMHHDLDLAPPACRTAPWPRSAPAPCSSGSPNRPRSCAPCSSADGRRPAPASRAPAPRRLQFRNGPPEAVSSSRRTPRRRVPGTKPAAGTGRSRCARCRSGSAARRSARTAAISSAPAMTADSLFASSRRLPAAAAASVERRPAAPLIAAIT